MDEGKRVQEYYRGVSVLVTGFTGFMGKVLVEKLLRSCHHLDKVYVVVRPKRGKTVKQRVQEILDTPLWERLAREKPDALKEKLVVLEGDVRERGLGLEPHQLETLRSRVAVVFHVAAAISFDQPLDLAIKSNTVSTKNVVDLALTMPFLKCLVHVSTTYCNCDRQVVEERVYPAHADWEQTLDISSTIDNKLFRILEKKYVGNMPNTYVFTKSLAEHVVWEQRHRIPVVIFRPSIVVSSYQEPVAGWTDNFNGPIGILAGFAKGVIRTAITDPDVVPDFMAVDLAIKAMIIAPTSPTRKEDGMVYNASSVEKSMSIHKMIETGMKWVDERPLEDIVWHYSKHTTRSRLVFTLDVWFRHLILALIVDTLLKITNNRPLLLKVHRQYFKAMMVLGYFTTHAWTFHNSHFLGLSAELSPEDKEEFDFDFKDVCPEEYFGEALSGAKKYLFKEKNDNPKWNLTKARIFYWLDWLVDCLKWSIIVWLLYKWGLFQVSEQLLKSALNSFQ